MFALAAHADEREAHVREVEQFGASLLEGSYGRANRQAIAAREPIATRLCAIEHAYQAVAGHDTAFTPPEPTRDSVLPGMRSARRSSLVRALRRAPAAKPALIGPAWTAVPCAWPSPAVVLHGTGWATVSQGSCPS